MQHEGEAVFTQLAWEDTPSCLYSPGCLVGSKVSKVRRRPHCHARLLEAGQPKFWPCKSPGWARAAGAAEDAHHHQWRAPHKRAGTLACRGDVAAAAGIAARVHLLTHELLVVAGV